MNKGVLLPVNTIVYANGMYDKPEGGRYYLSNNTLVTSDPTIAPTITPQRIAQLAKIPNYYG